MLKHLDDYKKFISEKAENTIKSYTNMIISYFNEYDELSVNNINDFIDSKKSYSSKNLIKASLRDFSVFLYNNNIIDNVIDLDKTKHIKKTKKLPVFLEDNEAENFMNVVKESGNIVHILSSSIMINLALRISECLSLKVSDINFKENRLWIHITEDYKTKSGKERIVYFNNNLADLLKNYISIFSLKNNDKLFNISGSQLLRVIKKYAKKAGIAKNITPHKLRHTCATKCLKEGVQLEVIKELLGHESILTTEIYTHVTKDSKKQVAQLVNY